MGFNLIGNIENHVLLDVVRGQKALPYYLNIPFEKIVVTYNTEDRNFR
ncbi:MAG: hypothetical protein ACYSTS_13615 [Planctomycetota bacterium]|jgi:hypothetical protein